MKLDCSKHISGAYAWTAMNTDSCSVIKGQVTSKKSH